MRLGIRAAAMALIAGLYVPCSQACERPGWAACTGLAEIDVVDRNTGEKLQIYWHDGQRWIAGTPGHRYSIGLRNNTSRRILGVVSVDGVNAISGETANWSQGGYVLSPWQSFDVLGWRKSMNHVADFVFSPVADSYAARTGRPDNAGVIGVALFREAVPMPAAPVRQLQGESDDARASVSGNAQDAPEAAPANPPSASAQAGARVAPSAPVREQKLGTGHGPSEASIVVNTDFRPARAQPDELVSIRYDRRDRLVAMGIVPPLYPPAPDPQPFPASAEAGFVADPPPRMR
jgi:hypothetical protein